MADDARDRFLGKASKRGVGALKGYGQASPLSEVVSGFVGAPRQFSVMDPDAREMQQARDLGEQASVASQLYGALMPFAAAATMAKAGQMGGISPLTAYHGSPHKFKKFDASKIGTGEGAQAYGHGLYFAENPKVAKEYAINLANRDLANQGRLNAHANAKRLATLAGDPKYAADDIRSALELNPEHEQADLLKATLEMLEFGDYAKPLKAPGSLYTVDIPDEKIAQMLDWDKPLSQQPKSVRDALNNLPTDVKEHIGIGKYDDLKGGPDIVSPLGGLVGDAKASEILRQAGIPGIRYLDAASRGAKQGTRNFVVFPGEEGALKILDVYAKGGAVHMQDGGSPLDRFTGRAPKRGASSLPGYGEGIDDPTTQALLAIRRNLGEAGRAAVGAKPYDETNPTETYRAMQALFNAPTPAAIIPEAAQAAGKAALALGGLGALRRGDRFTPMAVPDVPKIKESRYETAQEGPFFRVKPRSAQAARPKDRGVREEVRQADATAGSVGSDVSEPISDEAISVLIKDPSNFVRRVADDYSQRVAGQGYQLPEMPPSSLAKQSAIGRAFMLAAEGGDDYKKAVFEAYGRAFPDLIESTGAKNYDQLVDLAYRQLNKETADQFHALPVNMSFHRAGEGNYQSSGEMLRDVYGNRHLYVFQGGEPHPMMNRVNPETGLNDTEMFRAVHDFYGHAVHGNQFGPKGEEIAYGAHAQMFSPLARMAMASETRGQNSFVNYTPINAEIKQRINRLNEIRYEANRRGQTADVAEVDKLLGEAWQEFRFGPQKSVLLPPEFLDTAYTGGMPGYIQPLIRPEPGTTASEMLTHFSHSPGLQMLDPTRYGTGIKGREMERLLGTQNPVMERSYVYTGDPSRVRPEPGLGRFRYGTRSEGLYDLAADPLLLRTLAAEANRTPFTAKYNKGVADPSQAFTDVERMAKEYGYEGLMNPQQGTAILYRPTPVQAFQAGGAVKPVKEGLKKAIKGALEFAAGGAVHMQDGGKMDMSKDPRVYQDSAELMQQARARLIPTASELREAFERGPLAVARSAKRAFLSGGLPADILRAYGEASVPLNQAILGALGAPPRQKLESPPKVDELREAGSFIPIGDRYVETLGEILGDPLNFIPSAGTVKALGQAGKALGAAGLRKLDEAMLEGTGPLALAVRPVAPVAAASRFPRSSPPTVRPKIDEIAPPTRAEMLNELAQKGEPAAVGELARILGPEEIKVQPEMPVATPVVASAQAIEQVDQPIVMAGGPSIRPEQLDQPVADVIRRGQPIEPMTQPPTLDEVAAARSDSRTSAAIVAERLPIIVPEAERVLGGVYTPGRPDGGKWSDLTTEQLNKRGPGFKFTDNDLEKLWNESLSEVSEAAKQAVQKTGATWRGFTAEDFNIAFSLPLRHQLWYELSGEAFVDRLPDLNLRESLILLDLVGATSARAKPGENLERSLAILSQRMRGVPIDVDITIPSTVAQALRRDGSNISSDLANKTGMFADTIALTGGIPVRFPISVNDVWEARTYGITDEALSANQPLHEIFAKYQNKVRDLVNQSGTFEFPLQSWGVQSRKWVKQRFDDEGIDIFGPESLKGSDYSVEFDKIVEKLENAGINVPDGKITREVLMDPRTADALRPTTPRFRDAPKATVEVGTILTPSGRESYEIYKAAKTIGDVLTQDEYRGVLTSILYDSARGKPTPWEALVRVATDRAQPVTRIYSPTRDDPFSISGTFEGAAGPNIRVPLADMTPEQISYFNAVAGLGLKQKAMAAAEIKRVDPNLEFPQDAIPTSSVRFDYFSKVPETMLTDFTNALGKGFEISVMKYPDGLVFDINPRFTDAGPEGPTAQQIDQAVAVLQRKYNVQNLETFPTAYRSEYGKNYVEDDGTGATYRAIINDTLKGWNNGYAEAIQQVAGSRATRQDIEAFLEGRIDKLPLQVSEAGATSAEKSSILGKANTIRKAARQRASDHAAAVKAFEDIGLAVDRKMAEAIPRWKKRAERIAAQEAKKKPPQTPGMARGGAVRISQYRPYLLHHKFDEEFAAGGAVKPKTSEFEGMNFYDILFSR